MDAPFHQQVTFLFCDDLAAAHHFYAEIMGLSLSLDQGMCRIYQVTESAFIGLCQKQDLSPAPPDRVIFTFVTPDVDLWYQRLSVQGVAFEKTPALNPRFSIYHCFLRDPAGNLLEIQRFEDPAWPGA